MGNTSYSLRNMTGVRANSPLVCLTVKGNGVWYNVKLDWSLWLDLSKTDKTFEGLLKPNVKGSVYAKLLQGVEIVRVGKNFKDY